MKADMCRSILCSAGCNIPLKMTQLYDWYSASISTVCTKIKQSINTHVGHKEAERSSHFTRLFIERAHFSMCSSVYFCCVCKLPMIEFKAVVAAHGWTCYITCEWGCEYYAYFSILFMSSLTCNR